MLSVATESKKNLLEDPKLFFKATAESAILVLLALLVCKYTLVKELDLEAFLIGCLYALFALLLYNILVKSLIVKAGVSQLFLLAPLKLVVFLFFCLYLSRLGTWPLVSALSGLFIFLGPVLWFYLEEFFGFLRQHFKSSKTFNI